MINELQSVDFYELCNKSLNILVIGYGVTGKSVAQFLESKGHNVFVYDDDISAVIPNRVVAPDWGNTDLVVKSPSIRIMPHNRHPVVDEAMQHGTPICSAFDIFRIYNPNANIIGVTGTNGKSTTVSLIYHILKSAGISIALGGNIGIPYFDTLASAGNKHVDYYIFEMSSYELTSSKLLKFTVGCVLNIQPDHLDFHGSFENYVDAKCKLLEYSKYKVVSCDDTYTADRFIPITHSNKGKRTGNQGLDNVITVSVNTNTSADYYIDNKLLIANGKAVLDVSNLPNLVGMHNTQNLIFAYAICALIGVPSEKIIHGIKTFEPLPHRMNMVRKIGNVVFVNDSKATNPASVAPALATFTGYKIFWLAGGRSKHVNPMPYIRKYLDGVAKIYLFGEATEEFKKIFSDRPFADCKTIDVALHCAYQDAKRELSPSVVLFSPMCSSFDQFANFEQRGREFVRLVNELQVNE